MTRSKLWRGTPAGIALLVVVTLYFSTAWTADTRPWRFSDEPVGAVPQGWEVLSGRWEIRVEAPGTNRVLVQAGPAPPGWELSAILTPGPPVADLDARVKARAGGLDAFETIGLLLRWQDPTTMLIVRVDGTRRWIWVERVQDGWRSVRAGYSIDTRAPGMWNVLRVTARREWLNLFFNGKFLGSVRDDDPAPGRVGLVAGPGAAVLLDDVEVEALADLDNSG